MENFKTRYLAISSVSIAGESVILKQRRYSIPEIGSKNFRSKIRQHGSSF